MKNFIEFYNGQKMPLLGLGTSQATDSVTADAAFEEALRIGYRHFDTAYMYRNEELIGKVLKRWLDVGKVKRDELFIVTKLPATGMRPDLVGHFLEKSLKSLQLDYIDLYLVHSPVGFMYINDEERWPKGPDGNFLLDKSTNLEAIWTAMEQQVGRGLTKSIGLSNFAPSQIQRIVNMAQIRPACLQVELNTRFQQRSLVDLCQKLNIAICAYSPIGSPGRKEVYIDRGAGGTASVPALIEDPKVLEIAHQYGKTTAQILLRYLTQKNIAAIPKSVNSERLRKNFEVFDFELKSSDMTQLDLLDKGEAGRQFMLTLGGMDQHPECKKE